MEFFLPWGKGWGAWSVGKFALHPLKFESVSSTLSHCIIWIQKGDKFRFFFLFFLCLQFQQTAPVDSHRESFLCYRGSSAGHCSSVFQQTPLDDELLLGKSRTFDLLRKPFYCLLQKCPEAASSPSWGFKHMMAIYLFSGLSNSFSFLWFGTGEEGSTWMAATLHSVSNRSLLSQRLFSNCFFTSRDTDLPSPIMPLIILLPFSETSLCWLCFLWGKDDQSSSKHASNFYNK